jgi:D-sedoheptulose 7-phosphate isomerase
LKEFIEKPENLTKCQAFAEELIRTYRAGGTVFLCANGGSYCDALHFAEEMTGKYRKERPPLATLCLGDAAHLTCVGNDYGFEFVFSRQIQALGRPGDLLVLLSTSGKSKNLLLASDAAKSKNIRRVALLGRGGGDLIKKVDESILVPGDTSDRIQELHMILLHISIEMVERELFPMNYSE